MSSNSNNSPLDAKFEEYLSQFGVSTSKKATTSKSKPSQVAYVPKKHEATEEMQAYFDQFGVDADKLAASTVKRPPLLIKEREIDAEETTILMDVHETETQDLADRLATQVFQRAWRDTRDILQEDTYGDDLLPTGYSVAMKQIGHAIYELKQASICISKVLKLTTALLDVQHEQRDRSNVLDLSTFMHVRLHELHTTLQLLELYEVTLANRRSNLVQRYSLVQTASIKGE